MNRLKLYFIDEQYIEYLRKFDNKVTYNKNDKKNTNYYYSFILDTRYNDFDKYGNNWYKKNRWIK